MAGRGSIWDCELCASIGGVHGGLGREREREYNDFFFSFLFFFFSEREFNDLMT